MLIISLRTKLRKLLKCPVRRDGHDHRQLKRGGEGSRIKPVTHRAAVSGCFSLYIISLNSCILHTPSVCMLDFTLRPHDLATKESSQSRSSHSWRISLYPWLFVQNKKVLIVSTQQWKLWLTLTDQLTGTVVTVTEKKATACAKKELLH